MMAWRTPGWLRLQVLFACCKSFPKIHLAKYAKHVITWPIKIPCKSILLAHLLIAHVLFNLNTSNDYKDTNIRFVKSKKRKVFWELLQTNEMLLLLTLQTFLDSMTN